MDYIDYYKVLGLAKKASEKDIKKAYRKMARKYHPDLNPNDKAAEKKFKEINEANEVLSNTENRKKYDKHGKDWKHADEIDRQQQQYQQQSTGGGYGRAGGFGGGFDGGGGDYSDFFDSMFGGRGGAGGFGGNSRYKGQDFNAELTVTLKDVYKTHKQTLTVNGKKIRLSIPAGVENGQTIKIKGHGSKGTNGGSNGDLYITFKVINNTKFKRNKSDLYLTVDLDMYTAVLGGEIKVDTFSGGKVKLKVKPETQNDTKVKLKGKGFTVYKKDDQHGNLYITYKVKVPTNLSAKEKGLFTELSKLQ